jgi:hypothetical protein
MYATALEGLGSNYMRTLAFIPPPPFFTPLVTGSLLVLVVVLVREEN